MKLRRTGENEYTWEGLTAGKLLAIQNSLRSQNLTAVGNDILMFLNNNLENSFENDVESVKILIELGAGIIQEIYATQNIEVSILDDDIDDYDEDMLYEYFVETNPKYFQEAMKHAEKEQADWELERGEVNDQEAERFGRLKNIQNRSV